MTTTAQTSFRVKCNREGLPLVLGLDCSGRMWREDLRLISEMGGGDLARPGWMSGQDVFNYGMRLIQKIGPWRCVSSQCVVDFLSHEDPRLDEVSSWWPSVERALLLMKLCNGVSRLSGQTLRLVGFYRSKFGGSPRSGAASLDIVTTFFNENDREALDFSRSSKVIEDHFEPPNGLPAFLARPRMPQAHKTAAQFSRAAVKTRNWVGPETAFAVKLKAEG